MPKKLPEVGQPDAIIKKQRPIRQEDILQLREDQGLEPKAGALNKPLPVDLNIPADAVVGGVDEPKAIEEAPVTDESLQTIGTPPAPTEAEDTPDVIAVVTELIQELNDNGGNYRFVANLGEDDQYTFNVWSGKLLILVGATVDSIKTDL